MLHLLNKFLVTIDKLLTKSTIALIRLYQLLFSPDKSILFSPFLKWKVCLHYPHCSQYCIESLKRFWFFKGIKYCFERTTSCHPFGKENKFFLSGKIYEPVMYKIVFFSSAPIGIPFLEKFLQDKKFEVVWVVTTPPKPAWRWYKLSPSAIQKYVEEKNLNIPLQTPDKLKNNKQFKNWLGSLDADFFVVISYWKIIPKDILEIPKIAPLNIHGSILPAYRGASPIQSALLNQDKKTWITLMKMNEKMDEGDIIKTLSFPIEFEDSSKTIIEKMTKYWPNFIADAIWQYGRWQLQETPQDHNKATYCKKIEKQDGKINPFQDNLDSIWTKYKAFILWPWIFFEFNGKNIKITYLKLNKEKFNQYKNLPLIDLESKQLNPAVEEIKFRPEWKKDMWWKEFKNGYLG